MGATFVMSYPAADWQVVAGGNRSSASHKGEGNPRAALAEWIALADAIVYAGGRILVCEPPLRETGATKTATPPKPKKTEAAAGTGSGLDLGGGRRPTGMPYTADWGALVRRNDSALFLASGGAAPHRATELELVRAFFAGAGVDFQVLPCAWGGRSDLIGAGPGRYVYVAGARTAPGAAALVARELGTTARFVEARVRAPFSFGDELVAMLQNKAGDIVLLAHEGGLVDRTLPDLRAAFNKVEVLSVDEDDALAGACTALCVNGTVILPPELSTTLRGHLLRRGFLLVEQSMPELFGRGGGGPHALCNELVGFVLGDGAPDYTRARDRILGLLETYPERAI